MNFTNIEKAINTLAKKATTGMISVDEIDGGSFTISNGGVYGSLLSTPIINPLQDPWTENNPYLGFIYTSFQERATFISHRNTTRHAKKHGDFKLAYICGIIAVDEKRHETAYTKIVEKLYEIDPDGTVITFANTMRKKISMPAHLMYNGRDDNLFEHFSYVAQRLVVYTAKDYVDILEFLVGSLTKSGIRPSVKTYSPGSRMIWREFDPAR